MSENFDLLGDPIPDNWGGRGRPPHIPTAQNRNKVILLMAMGWKDGDIAGAIGITMPTLKKHYFRELKRRAEARFRVKGAHLEMLWGRAKDGSVTAMREFHRLMDKAEAEDAERGFLDSEPDASATSQHAARVGKKQQASVDATTAGLGTDWGGDLLPTRMN